MSADETVSHVDKLAYAVGLRDGAARIAGTARGQDILTIGLPFYLLIGFSLENGLKALLQFQQCGGNWHKSHDHAYLLSKTVGLEQALWAGAGGEIRHLSRYHREFWFRYPENAVEVAHVYKAESALMMLDHLLNAVDAMTGASRREREEEWN